MGKTNDQRISLDDISKLIAQLFTNLTGPNGLMWLEAFKRFLNKQECWTDGTKNLWRAFLAGGKSSERLIIEIEKANIKVVGYARSMMGKITTSKRSKKVNFAVKTLKEFGFEKSPTFIEFIEWVRNHHVYELCLAEDAPNMRIQYSDQPKGELSTFAMETITVSGGNPGVFRLAHDDHGMWLDSG